MEKKGKISALCRLATVMLISSRLTTATKCVKYLVPDVSLKFKEISLRKGLVCASTVVDTSRCKLRDIKA